MISCYAIRTRRVCSIFSRPCLSLTCLEQSYLHHLIALSRLGAPTQHCYLTPSLSAAMLTTCDVSPTGKQVQLFPLFIHALRVSQDQNWVASGSFNRTIKLWDLSRASQAATAPSLMTFAPQKRPAPSHQYMRLQSIHKGIRLCLEVQIMSSVCGIPV